VSVLTRQRTIGVVQPPRFSGLFGFLGFMIFISLLALWRLCWYTLKATWWLLMLIVAGAVAVTLALIAGCSTWAIVRNRRHTQVAMEAARAAIDAHSVDAPPPPPRILPPPPPPVHQTAV